MCSCGGEESTSGGTSNTTELEQVDWIDESTFHVYGLKYKRIKGDSVMNVGYIDVPPKGELTIPGIINTKNGKYIVTVIGEQAYTKCEKITSVKLPETIVTIERGAFSDCVSLSNINLPSSLVRIKSGAFYGCTSLTSIVIPSNVSEIGEDLGVSPALEGSVYIPSMNLSNPFILCTNLTSIKVDNRNRTFDSRNNCNAIIHTSTNEIICACKSTEIPNEVVTIGPCAFRLCKGLTSLKVPESVTGIANEAFSGCTNLVSISLPDNAKLGSYVFYNCVSLETITLPKNMESTGNGTFQKCSGLNHVALPKKLKIIGSNVFDGCEKLERINIPEGVTLICENAFKGCYGLESITLLVAPSWTR